MTKQAYLTTKGSFIGGRYVPKGHIAYVEPSKINPGQRNFVPAGDLKNLDVIEVSAIGPTGPNPTAPQQVPNDAVQTIEGYSMPGARLVGEKTRPEAERFAEVTEPSEVKGTQEQVQDKLDRVENKSEADALLDDGNDDDDLVDGTVADVVATIGPDTDLDALEAAENDREVPRKGVLSAIDKARKDRG